MSVETTASETTAPQTAVTPVRTAHHRRYLMCRPEHFTVNYSINPWMEPAKPTDTARAVEQWQKLYDLYLVLDPVQGVENGGPERANIAYLPGAFDDASRAILEQRFPDAILVSDEDGAVFGLNSASDGYNVIISPRAKGFEAQLRERGYNPILVDLSELLLGGGGIKCCTLELRGAQ